MKDENSLPIEIGDFNPEKLNDSSRKNLEAANIALLDIRNSDYKWRVKNRGWFGWSILLILIFQNLFVFSLIAVAYYHCKLCDIEWLFAAFFTVVMVQTYLTTNHLIKWLFTEIDYKLHK